MSADLGLSDAVFDSERVFFSGIFSARDPRFFDRRTVEARRWIARILLTWGLSAILVGFVRTQRDSI
jgi:ACS family tartrate transporter-like MFS transporter